MLQKAVLTFKKIAEESIVFKSSASRLSNRFDKIFGEFSKLLTNNNYLENCHRFVQIVSRSTLFVTKFSSSQINTIEEKFKLICELINYVYLHIKEFITINYYITKFILEFNIIPINIKDISIENCNDFIQDIHDLITSFENAIDNDSNLYEKMYQSYQNLYQLVSKNFLF